MFEWLFRNRKLSFYYLLYFNLLIASCTPSLDEIYIFKNISNNVYVFTTVVIHSDGCYNNNISML